ncbi:MAG: NAD(P)-binding protein [Micrococcales bacterium]|nr:NAD(P)-binding protein [Micrococcales bacterium]
MRILIVGAGAAGITAGHALSEKRIDFEILEASSVHGGRVKKTAGFADFPIDLGAEWVHRAIKAKAPTTQALLSGQSPEFRIFNYRPKTILQYKNGKLRSKGWMKLLLALVNDGKFADSTWFDFIDQLVTPEMKKKIHYSTPVIKIEHSSNEIVATSASGEQFRADKVLITVPIKMLQDEYIEFAPALPDWKKKAINKEQFGDGLKVFIEFSEKFYPDVVEIGSAIRNPLESDDSYYDATVGKNSSKNILALFAHGPTATKYTSLKTDKALLDFILKELDEVFDGQATRYYKKHIIQNWSKEPFIGGSYSMRKGSVKELSAPLNNKIYFAGEAMNPSGKTIAVHGACESAYLAVSEMLTNKDRR